MPHKPFAFFGTPFVARDTLAQLVAHGYVPHVVVTSPDMPRGRGMQRTPCDTKAWALAQGLPVRTPERLDGACIEELRALGCDYAIVVAYGKILPQALIDAFPLGVLNIHYSLLPKYRGASPVEAALLAGDTVTGVSIQQMVYELDAGDILASRAVPIGADETARELRPRLIAAGAALLLEILPAFEAGTITPIPQDHARATHTRKIPKAAGELSLSGDSHENYNRYRAYAESPGTYFFMDRDGVCTRVKIRTATLDGGRFLPDRVTPEGRKETAYAELLRLGWKPR